MGSGYPRWEQVGHAMRAARRARGLGRKQLVEALGYRNVSRGLRRLDQLEAGSLEPRFFERACAVIEPDPKELADAFGRDRARQDAWLDEPVPIRFAIKWMPAVFESIPLPDEARHDPEAAEAFARRVIREKGRRCEHVEGWLTLDRRRTLILDSTGRVLGCLETGPAGSSLPHLHIRGRTVHLGFGDPEPFTSGVSPGPAIDEQGGSHILPTKGTSIRWPGRRGRPE